MFLQAVDYTPEHRKALKALTGLAIREEDWTQAVRYIAMEINLIKEPAEKVEVLTDLGSLYHNKLKLIQKAREAFQMALDIDPKSTVAIEAMADILFSQEELAKAEPLFGRLSLLVDKKSTDKLSNIYYKWGVIAEKLGRKDEAIIRYSNALDSNDNNLDALQALGDLYYERAQWGFDKAQWQEALDIYERIYQHPHLDEDKVDVIKRLAIIQEHLGHNETAIANYLKVLAEIPEDHESIVALSKLHINSGQDQEALKFLQMIIKSEAVSFVDRRNAMLSIADAYTRMQQYREAVDNYLKAFSMGVEDPVILKKIGQCYINLSQWDEAYEWIDKHYTCLEAPEEKVENRCLMARIMENGRQQPADAIALYQEALRIDPAWMPALDGIVSIYEKQERWDAMAQSYKTFLENLPAEKQMDGMPAHLALGRLYNEKLMDWTAAIEEFSKILTLDNEHTAAHVALANIKAEDPLLYEDAIKEHLFLLKRDAFRVASYRGLYRLYRKRDEADKALRVCRVLNLIDNLTEEEKKFMAAATPQKIGKVDFDSLVWYLIPNRGGVYHECMALTAEHMSKVFPVDLEQRYGLRKKDRITATDQNKVNYHVEKIKETLGVAGLDLYINPRKSHRIFIENTQPPSLIISQFLLEALPDLEIRFLLSKYIFYIAQQQVLACKLDAKELARYFRLLRGAFIGESGVRSSEDEVLMKRIKSYLPRKMRKALSERTDLWEGMLQQDVGVYLKWLEFASNRCGLLMTDSLKLTVQMIYRLRILKQSGKLVKLEKMGIQDIAKIDAIQEILLYNISDEYGKLRKAVGIAI